MNSPHVEAEAGSNASENNLETANAELAEAEHELQKAEHDVEKAEREIEKALQQVEHPNEFKVGVIYNGVDKPFEVRREELTVRLLDQARQAFGTIPNPHLLSLFTKAGVELNDDQTIEQAGVKPHDVLLLRPGTVRGG
jgi:hypothetical protein